MVSERKQSKENSVDSRDGEVRTRVRLPSSPLTKNTQKLTFVLAMVLNKAMTYNSD